MSEATYDRLWKTVWGDIQRLGPVHRHSIRLLLKTVSSLDVRTILDVGCGNGEVLAALAQSERYVLAGTDISGEALALAATRVPGATFSLLDIERDTLPTRYDLVICLQVIEHLVDDIAAIRNIAAMSSRLVFLASMQGRMRASELEIGHVRNYTKTELGRKMELAGLRVVRIHGWGFPFYSPLYRTLSELLPGGPPTGKMGRFAQLAAAALYQLYRLNVPGRGDVIMALGEQLAPTDAPERHR
ncbi:MAG: methyltransferase domain-containing protein [Gemmatimonadetes bacterium]|nr:methyltransferase domain-containing protein [Gemmatimonadota bacterium]